MNEHEYRKRSMEIGAEQAARNEAATQAVKEAWAKENCRRTCSGYWWDPYTRTEWDQGGGDREFRVTSHDEKCPKYKEESV